MIGTWGPGWFAVGAELAGAGVAAGIAAASMLVPSGQRPPPEDVAFAVVSAILLGSAFALGALAGTAVHALRQ